MYDEWKSNFRALPALYPIIRELGEKFGFADMSEDAVYKALDHQLCSECRWLSPLRDGLLDGRIEFADGKVEILRALIIVGIVGVRLANTSDVIFSFEQSISLSHDDALTAGFYVHKTFWRTFDFSAK